MKNNIYKTIGLITIFLVTINTIAQDRNVIWVHGLNDNAGFWQHYDGIFENERQINGSRGSYTTTSINNGSNHVATVMNNTMNGATNSQNIGIGHSMGGLMIRNLDRTAPANAKNFGGIITVATPNYGAPIINSAIDGDVNDAKSDACVKLAAGPSAQLFNLPWDIIPQSTNSTICEILFNGIIQDFEDDGNDLRVGSPTINAINNYATTIPQISIWAEENSPVHWRMATAFTNKNWVNDANTIRNIYNSHYTANKALAISNAFFNPFAAFRYHFKAKQWKKGRDWMDDSETIYSSLIKTTHTEVQTYWANVWVPCPYPPIYPTTTNSTVFKNVDPDCGEWVWQEQTRYVTINYPSDGLFPQYTQELQNIPTGNKYHVSGANHLEVGNMTTDGNSVDETKDVFDDIFDRPVGNFFRTN